MKTIWTRSRDDEMFVRARRNFELLEISGPYQVKVTCSGRYRLWINGVSVARGPAHSGTDVKRVDELDVTRFLQAGRNQIAVQLTHFNYFTAQGWCAAPAFAFSLKGRDLSVESDTVWKMSVDAAFQLPSHRRNNMYGPQELYDARLEQDWQTEHFDDSDWPQAVDVECPWGREIPRGVPFRMEYDLRPVSVFKVAEVVDQEHFPEMWHYQSYQSLAETLLQDVPEETRLSSVHGAENLLDGASGSMTVVQPFADDPDRSDRYCASVIFDFGREITGYTRFEVEGNAGAMIDVVHGELITAGRVQAMRQGTHYADRYILREGRQRHEIYDWKGFRYIQLTFRNLTRPLMLHDLRVSFCSYPVTKAGRFKCEDKLLEQIWQTGAYTQQLCMHDRLMDCPWREQVQWLGDGRIQLVIIQNAFGANDLCRKFVEDFAHSQLENGLVPSISGAGSNGPVRDIIDYALWWILAVEDVISFENDETFVHETIPHIQRLLRFFGQYVNDDGMIENIPGWVFIDWANLCREGCVAPLNGIYAMALQCAERLARRAGETELANSCHQAASRIREKFHELFWSDEHGYYRDCVRATGPYADGFSQHTQVIAVLSGLARVSLRDLMERTLADKTLVQTMPFFSFYLLEGLVRVGMGREAVDFIREQWGRMIHSGATTFWEEWQVGGTYRDGFWAARPRSLCHAWSAAPTAWLSRHVLGIHRDEQTNELRFAPQCCGLSTASGSVPTRHGMVDVFWTVLDGQFRAELTLPQEDLMIDFQEPEEFEGASELIIHNRKKSAQPETVCS